MKLIFPNFTLPLWFHINGLPEILLQSLLLAAVATYGLTIHKISGWTE